MTIVSLGASNSSSVRTFSAASISGYQNLTADDFIVELISAPDALTVKMNGNYAAHAVGLTVTKQYDNQTGLFTLSGLSQSVGLQSSTGINSPVTQSLVYRVWVKIVQSGGTSFNPVKTTYKFSNSAYLQTVSGFEIGKHYCLSLSHSSNWNGASITSGATAIVGPLTGQTYSSGDAYIKVFVFEAASTSVTLQADANCSSCLVQLD